MSTATWLLLLCLAVFTEVSYQKPSSPNHESDVNFCESRYNCYERKHLLCELGHKCSQDAKCKDFEPVPLTEDDKKLILDVHNKYRSYFALGNEKRSLDGKSWPSAANMREFVWDEELEFYAQCWANQCPVSHSPCRIKTDGLWVGENLSWATYDDNIDAIKGYYDEAENASTAIVDEFQKSVDEYKIGHFTQLIFANTSQLGCARSKYYFEKFKRPTYFLACEYAFAGNWLGAPIYKKGTPCSACPQGSECHKKYKGLCTTEPSTSKEPNICKFSTDKDCQPSILGKVSKVKGTTEKPEQTKRTKNRKKSKLDDEQLITKVADKVFEKLNSKLEEFKKQFEEQILVSKTFEDKLNDLEQYTRRKNIRIFGIPEEKNEDLEAKIINLCKSKANIIIKPEFVDSCYRMGIQKKGKARPVIMKFVSYKYRSILMNNIKKFAGSQISVKEDLTKERQTLLKYAASKFGYNNVRSSDGIIKVKFQNKIWTVKNTESCDKIIAGVTD